MTELQRLQEKYEKVKEELDRLKKLPEYDVYLGMLVQIGMWNMEMQHKPVSIKSGTEEDTRAFDKMIKYMDQRSKLYADLEIIRNKLFPSEVAQAEQESTSLVDDARKSILKDYKESEIPVA